MRRLYGRALPGNRAQKITPTLRSKNINVIATMTKNELLHYKVLDGSGNRQRMFDFLVELIKLLENIQIHEATIIMDNASFHHCEEIENLLIAAKHEVVFLPPYSPFFNAIEYVFSQWKSHVRSKEGNNIEDLKKNIQSFYGVITSKQCENYYLHIVQNAHKCIAGDVLYDT